MKRDQKSGILYREWSARFPKAVFLLVHGLGAHSARWEFLSDFFLQNNISSYSLELKGFGETKSLKGHIDSFNIYFEDILCLYNIIRQENPGNKIFLLGESLGGLISFLMAIQCPDLFAGLICISPAFKSKLKFTILEYIKIFFSLSYNPRKQFDVHFSSGMCTRDVGYQKVMDSDLREYRFVSSKLLQEAAFAQIRAQALKGRLRTPVLFLLSGQDRLVDLEASRQVFFHLRLKDKTKFEYPEMLHALSVDLGRERVFKDVLRWVEKIIEGRIL